VVELVVQLFDRHDVAEVSFVELQHVREPVERDPLQKEVLLEVFEAVGIRALHRPLGVSDKDDPVGASQDELAGRVVMHLSGNGIELQRDIHAANGTDFERQEVEEDGSIALGGEGNHLAPVPALEVVVDPHQIGGLAAQSGAVIHDLRIELTQGVIEENHGNPSAKSYLSRPLMITRIGIPSNPRVSLRTFSR
jgi:hypothetical protein